MAPCHSVPVTFTLYGACTPSIAEAVRKMRLLLLLTISLAGCATSVFTPPPPDSTAATIATRFEYHPTGNMRWQRFEVTHLDGEHQLATSILGESNTNLKVKQGVVRLTVRAAFHGWPTVPEAVGIQEATVDLTAPVQNAGVYRLGGEPRAGQYFVWLEELSTGRRVSEATGRYAPQGHHFYFSPVPLKR